jgi:hypothetical protein
LGFCQRKRKEIIRILRSLLSKRFGKTRNEKVTIEVDAKVEEKKNQL